MGPGLRAQVGGDDAAVGTRDEDFAGDVVQLRNAFGCNDLDQGVAGRKTRKY